MAGDDKETVIGGAVVQAPRGALPHGSQVAGYRIGPQLGRGGMGVVYKAHHIRLDRSAALKVLAPELAANDQFRRRFMSESQMAATLDHPHVVTVYDAGEDDGLLYLAMKHIAGTDLRSLLELEGPLDLVRAVGVLSQVASALDAAHARGLVHRDVKPGNILLDVHRAYLGDFGLTKRFDATSGLTGVNQLVGTVDYLAPEQIEGAKVDGRSDQYALACVAYEALAGRPPHQKDSAVALMFAHVREEPEPLSAQREDVSFATDEVMARALNKDPARRYGSCGEFVLDLAAELGVEAPDLPGQKASAHVVVASDDPATRAIVKASLVGVGAAVNEFTSTDELPDADDRAVDVVIADTDFGADPLARLLAHLTPGHVGGGPKLMLLVPRQSKDVPDDLRARADAELAKPFSGMQLALRLRKLLGSSAVRV